MEFSFLSLIKYIYIILNVTYYNRYIIKIMLIINSRNKWFFFNHILKIGKNVIKKLEKIICAFLSYNMFLFIKYCVLLCGF